MPNPSRYRWQIESTVHRLWLDGTLNPGTPIKVALRTVQRELNFDESNPPYGAKSVETIRLLLRRFEREEGHRKAQLMEALLGD